MTIRELQYFTAVYETGGVSSAAKILHVSQPALSQTIRKMEQTYGMSFFLKGQRKPTLTEAGRIIYHYGKSILDTNRLMETSLRDLTNPEKQKLRIGISPFYSKYYIPPLLPQISKAFSQLKCEIVEDISVHLEKMLVEGKIDLCFVPLEPENPSLYYETLCIEEILLAVPKNYEVNEKAIKGKNLPYLDLGELKQLPFVSLKQVQKISELTNKACQEMGFSPNVVYETLDWDTVDILIGSGLGVGFVPDILYKKNRKDGPNYYRIANIPITRHYGAAWVKGKPPTPLAREVISLFRENLSKFHNADFRNS